ncbi:hypothetical protein D3C76_1502040 [compost metagenome]
MTFGFKVELGSVQGLDESPVHIDDRITRRLVEARKSRIHAEPRQLIRQRQLHGKVNREIDTVLDRDKLERSVMDNRVHRNRLVENALHTS